MITVFTGLPNGKIAMQTISVRRNWTINPVTKVVGSRKRYTRKNKHNKPLTMAD